MRVAAIDIGTNSVLLLVADAGAGGALTPLLERATITRLGQGVDRTRALDDGAVARTLACLEDYGEAIRSLGVTRVAAVGTSAMRDARGGDAFVARAAVVLGTPPQVISGEDEAALTFEGALIGLPAEPGDAAHAGRRAVVFDIGGGSTELIVGDAAGAVTAATSLDVGSVRLTERHVRCDPPTPSELDAVRADVQRALASERLSPFRDRDARWVGVAGTVTTLAAIADAIDPYDPARVHGARLDDAQLGVILTKLCSAPLAARRSIRGLEPARADIIVAGCLIVLELLGWSKANELVVSDRGVRWGLARRLAAVR